MILIKCNDCQSEMKLLRVITKNNLMFDAKEKRIKCASCSSEDVSRILTPANEGTPNVGAWSSQNEYNRKG